MGLVWWKIVWFALLEGVGREWDCFADATVPGPGTAAVVPRLNLVQSGQILSVRSVFVSAEGVVVASNLLSRGAKKSPRV